MKKLVYGVGVNDLGYRTQVYGWVTKEGGERVWELVFVCKFYLAWKNMLMRCYSKKYLESHPTYIGRSYVTSGCRLWHFENGWRSKPGRASA